jgi:formate-dependent nitrite reductase membrane component NrfD
MSDFTADKFPLAIGFKRQTEWGEAPMILEMFFGAAGGGLFIVCALTDFMWGAIIAFVGLMAGKGIFVMADLGKPMRMLNVFKRPFKSWISFGGLCFVFCGVFGLIYCLMIFFSAGGPAVLWIVRTLAIVFAAIVAIYDGFWLSGATGVSAWNSSVLPVLLGLSGLAAGIGLAQILAPLFGGYVEIAWEIHAGVLVAELISAFCYAEGLAKGRTGARKSFELLVKGPLTGSFIVCALIICTLIPAVAVGAAIDGIAVPGGVWICTGILETLGVIFLRHSILKAGVYTPVI